MIETQSLWKVLYAKLNNSDLYSCNMHGIDGVCMLNVQEY